MPTAATMAVMRLGNAGSLQKKNSEHTTAADAVRRVAYFPRRTAGMRKLVFFISMAAMSVGIGFPIAQQPPAVSNRAAMTAADYARAEKMLPGNLMPLVHRAGVRANWLTDDRFWYRVTTTAGSEAVLVDPAKATKAPCTLPECEAARGARGRRGEQAAGGRGATRND